jgi:oxalate decarboxylase/phosphoglucose isomerase-like protein (cupin superfamily)
MAIATDQVALRNEVKEQAERTHQAAKSYKGPYQKWKEMQGIDTIYGLSVPNVYTTEVKPWAARGGSGVFINLDGSAGFNDSYIYELAPKEQSVPIRHIYDELIFVLSGRGATTVWNDEKKKQTFEWGKGSYFAMPPNAWHQHFNLSGDEPARYFAMTAAPRVIDTFKSLDFVFNNNHVFTDFFNDDEGFFKESERKTGSNGTQSNWRTNFIADVWAHQPKRRASVEEVEARSRAAAAEGNGWKAVGRFLKAGEESAGSGAVMLNGTVHAGLSFGSQPGTHSPLHRHGPGIHVTTIGGHGYSILISPAGDQTVRVDWGPGTVFVPPEGWWHGHFNTGPEPWDWLKVGWGSEKPKPGGGHYDYSRTPQEGGDQVAFEDQDPAVHHAFEKELETTGVKCLMYYHPHCTQR